MSAPPDRPGRQRRRQFGRTHHHGRHDGARRAVRPRPRGGRRHGHERSDNVTSTASGLTIRGSGVSGSTVTLYDDANNDGIRNGSEAALGTAAVNAGAFSLDIALSAGLHHVRAVQADLAGNLSASSSALDITVEAPPALAWITLAPITADNIVKSVGLPATVPVTGTVGGEADPGDAVSVTVNGTEYTGLVQPGSVFSIDVPAAHCSSIRTQGSTRRVTTTIDGQSRHGDGHPILLGRPRLCLRRCFVLLVR